ncbi:MAG: hypothetical protein WCJ61_00155 [Paludibacter sp.]
MKKQPFNQAQKASQNYQATLTLLSGFGGLLMLILLAALTSCSSSTSKDAKNKIYTSNGLGIKCTESGELYGGNLSGFKGRTSTVEKGSSNINIPRSVSAPSAALSEVDVDKLPERQVARTSINGINAYNQSQSKTFKSSIVENSALQPNAPNSDINTTLKTRATDNGTKVKATSAGKKVIQKGGPAKPAEPGMGSLPIGDGTLLLLLLGLIYSVFLTTIPNRHTSIGNCEMRNRLGII